MASGHFESSTTSDGREVRYHGDAESRTFSDVSSASSTMSSMSLTPSSYARGCGCGFSAPLYSRHVSPPFITCNPYLEDGFRVSLSYRDCVKSVFMWTNETINIWTHLLGFFYFAYLLVHTNTVALPSMQSVTQTDHIVASAFILCAMSTMMFSVLYHIFLCHSPQVYEFWLKVDLCGIVLSIWACYFIGSFYAFYCFETWQRVYCTLILLIAAANIAVSLDRRFLDDSRHCLRLVFFVLSVAVSVVPTTHWVVLHGGFGHPDVKLFFSDVLVMWLILLGGVLVYALKIPERWWPGKVDYVGASHQLWHVLVFVSLAHWHRAGMAMVRHRHESACEPPPSAPVIAGL